jgi:hypothetical protein
MIYGYARVSTAAQDETGQVRQLKTAGCEKIFREKITGTTADRPQFTKLMKKLAPGDVVITPAVDRLSRDTTDLLVIAREMQRAFTTGRRHPTSAPECTGGTRLARVSGVTGSPLAKPSPRRGQNLSGASVLLAGLSSG